MSWFLPHPITQRKHLQINEHVNTHTQQKKMWYLFFDLFYLDYSFFKWIFSIFGYFFLIFMVHFESKLYWWIFFLPKILFLKWKLIINYATWAWAWTGFRNLISPPDSSAHVHLTLKLVPLLNTKRHKFSTPISPCLGYNCMFWILIKFWNVFNNLILSK